MFGQGRNGARAPQWRVQLTVIGAHRENMTKPSFSGLSNFSTWEPTLITETRFFELRLLIAFLNWKEVLFDKTCNV